MAGARLDGTLGQATPESTHLIKTASEAACGLRDRVFIFGTDYPTPDGTCVRDYLHVEDLARAHIDALEYLRRDGASRVLNCGYGKGYSVREILKVAREVSGVDFPVEEAARRAGDPPSLVADARRIRDVLGWRPRHDDIRVICESAIRWERSLQGMSKSRKP